MGKFRQTKKDLLGKSSQGSRNKVSWKAFLQALGKCFFHKKKWFKIFKIYIIYDLLVYMGSKKAYAGINLGDSGYSWNYAREIWSNTNHVKKPTKTPNKTLFSSVSTFSPLPDGFTMFYHVIPVLLVGMKKAMLAFDLALGPRMGCRKNTYSACNAKRSRQLCMAHFHLNTCSLPDLVEYCTNAPGFQGVKMPRIYWFPI